MMKKLIKTELIEKYMEERNLTKYKFSKMCNISPSTLTKILNHNIYVRIKSIFKIARVLNVEVVELFND